MNRSAVRWALGVLLAIVPVAAGAQSGGEHRHETTNGSSADQAMTEAAMAGMQMDANPHMRLTPMRTATDDDRRRAAAIVTTLRASLERYRDVRAAEADGYAMFLPGVRSQPVYHYTNRWRAAKAAVRFDPAQPTSLLYRKDASGAMVLVGAMYTAPRAASLAELDRRVPLGVARWHQHVDICVPPRSEKERWAERSADGRMRFGPAGAIATREACDAAGGRFIPQLFGWMVHANVFAGDDPAAIWGEHH